MKNVWIGLFLIFDNCFFFATTILGWYKLRFIRAVNIKYLMTTLSHWMNSKPIYDDECDVKWYTLLWCVTNLLI